MNIFLLPFYRALATFSLKEWNEKEHKSVKGETICCVAISIEKGNRREGTLHSTFGGSSRSGWKWREMRSTMNIKIVYFQRKSLVLTKKKSLAAKLWGSPCGSLLMRVSIVTSRNCPTRWCVSDGATSTHLRCWVWIHPHVITTDLPRCSGGGPALSPRGVYMPQYA